MKPRVVDGFEVCVLGLLALLGACNAAAAGENLPTTRRSTTRRSTPAAATSQPSQSPLARAAHEGDLDKVLELLSVAEDVRVFKGRALIAAIAANHPQVALALIDGHAPVDATDDRGNSAVYLAASSPHPAMLEVLKRLLAAGGKVDSPNNRGFTPLHGACERGTSECVKLLLANGANPNAKELDHGDTPLHVVAISSNLFDEGYVEKARVLIEHHADIDARDKDGQTALEGAVEERRAEERDAYCGERDKVIAFLQDTIRRREGGK